MSTLRVEGIKNAAASSDAITLASDGTCTAKVTNNLSNRNLIINGAMQVNQRGTKTGITADSMGGPDRFRSHIVGLGGWTASQQTSATDLNTTGFQHSFRLQNTTANASPGASNYAILAYRLEGYDTNCFQWGTANAKQVTLSFWCKANISGWSSGTKSFVAELQGGTTTLESGQLVTLNNNDTWQKFELTYPAQTAQVLGTTNAESLAINLWLDSGSNFTSGTLSSAWSNKSAADRCPGLTLALANNTANYFQITGVQLEVSDHATSFEHRSYGDELARCQRYYEGVYMTDGTALMKSYASFGGSANFEYQFAVPKRARPTWSLEGNASWSGATPNAYESQSSCLFQVNSGTLFSLGDAADDLCGSFSAEL